MIVDRLVIITQARFLDIIEANAIFPSFNPFNDSMMMPLTWFYFSIWYYSFVNPRKHFTLWFNICPKGRARMHQSWFVRRSRNNRAVTRLADSLLYSEIKRKTMLYRNFLLNCIYHISGTYWKIFYLKKSELWKILHYYHDIFIGWMKNDIINNIINKSIIVDKEKSKFFYSIKITE